jgi:hypothetical protein
MAKKPTKPRKTKSGNPVRMGVVVLDAGKNVIFKV